MEMTRQSTVYSVYGWGTKDSTDLPTSGYRYSSGCDWAEPLCKTFLIYVVELSKVDLRFSIVKERLLDLLGNSLSLSHQCRTRWSLYAYCLSTWKWRHTTRDAHLVGKLLRSVFQVLIYEMRGLILTIQALLYVKALVIYGTCSSLSTYLVGKLWKCQHDEHANPLM